MSKYEISCTVGTTDPAAVVGLEVWLDNHVLFDTAHVANKAVPLAFELGDDEAEHELRFVMKGKTSDNTTLDEHNNIVKDACITINDIAFDEIKLNQVFIDHAVYTHDFNGTQDTTQGKFYGTMGCNGTVSLKFTTPIYLWLLENM